MKTTSILSEVKEAKKVNALRYRVAKVYTEGKDIFKIAVNINLDDDCKNGCCDWSITADIYRKAKNNRWYHYSGGCCHEEIQKHFPEFQKFVNLHLSDYCGAPLYAVENGYYIMHHDGKDKAKEYLRITDEEAETLCAAPDKAYFKYLLYELGIVARWKNESFAAISELENMTGCKWVDPYEFEEEKRHIAMFTDEEAADMNNKIDSGYYEPKAIEARKEEERKKAIEKKRNEIISRAEKAFKKAEEEKTVLLYILDSGLPVDNVIYYDHTKKVVFNWLDYKDKISQADFVNFLANVDYSKLPKDITFEIK